MVLQFELDLQPKHRKHSKNKTPVRPGKELGLIVRERCGAECCYTSLCWVPADDNGKGQIYLPHYYFKNSKRGRYVQLRQVLWQVAYDSPPPRGRKIHSHCGTPGCVNPGHMYVRGWTPTYPQIYDLINRRGWLTEEQAKQWLKRPKAEA